MTDPRATTPLIQWQFERGDRHVACLINLAPETQAAPAFEVATVPLWDVAHAAVETFDSPREAIHRHAAIAADLREAGWTLAAYTA